MHHSSPVEQSSVLQRLPLGRRRLVNMVEEPRLLGPGDEVGDIEDGGDGAYGVAPEAPQGRRRRGLLLLRHRRFLDRLLLRYCSAVNEDDGGAAAT